MKMPRATRVTLASISLGLSLWLPGCIRTTTTSPDFGSGSARQAQATNAWKVSLQGQLEGYLVRFRESQGAQSVLISVRNAHNQDMGWIDAQGKAWRYRLHEDPEWIGTGSKAMAAGLILDLAQDVTLEPVELAELPLGPALPK